MCRVRPAEFSPILYRLLAPVDNLGLQKQKQAGELPAWLAGLSDGQGRPSVVGAGVCGRASIAGGDNGGESCGIFGKRVGFAVQVAPFLRFCMCDDEMVIGLVEREGCHAIHVGHEIMPRILDADEKLLKVLNGEI